jgi:hypothetical protein
MKRQRGSVSVRELFGIAMLFVGLMVLIVRHSTAEGRVSDEAAAATAVIAAPAVEATTVPAAPASQVVVDTAARDAARKSRLAHDVAQVAPLLGQWSSAANLAMTTPAEGLQPRIAELQDIRARFGDVQLSEQCAVQAQQANGDAMDAHITYFIAVANHWSSVQKSLEKAEQATAAAKTASSACHV